MKKLFYLAVILCFVQVGISSAQTSVVNDKKTEQVSSQKSPGSDVVTPTTMTSNESVTPTSSNSKTSCTATKENPTCCQKKGTTSSCCSGANSTSTSKKNNPKSQKDASLNQNTGTTPK